MGSMEKHADDERGLGPAELAGAGVVGEGGLETALGQNSKSTPAYQVVSPSDSRFALPKPSTQPVSSSA